MRQSALGDIGAVLLAAGVSRRFGSDKRLHTDTTGEPMLVSTARSYSAVFESLVIVLRAEDQCQDIANLLHRCLTTRPQLVFAEQATLGMGHSLAAAAPAMGGWQGVFVGLADMPFVDISTLRNLRDELANKLVHGETQAIVQPSYQGQPGHPVGFSATYIPQLQQLQGDTGAKQLLTQNTQHLVRVECTDEGVIRDIDRL